MDLYERLYDQIASLQLPIKPYMGFLLDQPNMLCLYPLPGSQTTDQYFDGTLEREMLYEVGFFTNDQQIANETMWKVTNFLDGIEKIESKNDSFDALEIEVAETPYISVMDERGYITYLLDLRILINQY